MRTQSERATRAASRRGLSLLEMMVATAIMATLMASVVVVMRSGYAVWNAQEADIDVLENGYGVLRHFVQQMRQADAVTAISAAERHDGRPVVHDGHRRDAHLEPQRRARQVYFNNGTSNQLLAKNIDTLTFTGYKADGVTHDDGRRRHPGREVHGAGHAAARRGRDANAVLPGLDSIVVSEHEHNQHNANSTSGIAARSPTTPARAASRC